MPEAEAGFVREMFRDVHETGREQNMDELRRVMLARLFFNSWPSILALSN